MFQNNPEDLGMEEDDEFISQTQTQGAEIGTRQSRLEYWWLITFQWDINVEEPFKMYVRSIFKNRIPISWYQGGLNLNCRQIPLNLPGLPGKSYSIFAKVEKGINYFY